MPTTDVMDQTETDIRERILITTERLFREIGYQKTTVADIAKTLRMSPANVYRFFDSKRSITAGVVSRQMGDVDQALQAIAGQPQSATERLREMLITIFRMNSERFAGELEDARDGRGRHGGELGRLPGAHRQDHRRDRARGRRRHEVG